MQYATKVKVVTDWLEKIGLMSPTEASYVHLAALLFTCSRVDMATMTFETALAVVNDLKTSMRTRRGRGPRMPHHNKIVRLSADPSDLEQAEPDVYLRIYSDCGGRPAPNRVDEHALIRSLALFRRTPVARTNIKTKH